MSGGLDAEELHQLEQRQTRWDVCQRFDGEPTTRARQAPGAPGDRQAQPVAGATVAEIPSSGLDRTDSGFKRPEMALCRLLLVGDFCDRGCHRLKPAPQPCHDVTRRRRLAADLVYGFLQVAEIERQRPEVGTQEP